MLCQAQALCQAMNFLQTIEYQLLAEMAAVITVSLPHTLLSVFATSVPPGAFPMAAPRLTTYAIESTQHLLCFRLVTSA